MNVVDNVNQNGIGFGLTITRIILSKLGGTFDIFNNCEQVLYLKKRKSSVKSVFSQSDSQPHQELLVSESVHVPEKGVTVIITVPWNPP